MENPVASSITLFELNQLVRKTIEQSMPDYYWIVAEISEIKEHPSGHCYLELCQKDDQTNALKAKARATIWAFTYRMLKPYFETTTHRSLERGLKILIKVQPVFHEQFGYSLNINDIEPAYTLGDIELKRRETIRRLTNDGVVDMNKDLQFADLPKRIAIISSPKAAGLQDFVNQLTNNQYEYCFEHEVFASIMQGDEAEVSIIQSLNNINERINCFDVVVIVRGGGSQSDLSCFDSYELALNVAQFPLPVVTGIGHDKDKSVVDIVAYNSLKTPTAAAEFLISVYTDADEQVQELSVRLSETVRMLLERENALIGRYCYDIKSLTEKYIQNKHIEIERLARSIPIATNRQISKNKEMIVAREHRYLLVARSIISTNRGIIASLTKRATSATEVVLLTNKVRLDKSEMAATLLDPKNMLKRGYSITSYKGKPLIDPAMVGEGDEVETRLEKGIIRSNITSILE